MVMVLLPFVLAYLPVHLPELITHFATQSPWLSRAVCNKSRRLASFLPSTVLLWNSLPPLVISTSSSSAFLRNLDIHFQSDRYSFGLT